MQNYQAKFQIGQIIQHKLFDYVGVVFDVDAVFEGTDEWYQQVALSRPPRDEPWYHVLVNQAVHTTYVAERNLEVNPKPQKMRHPLIDEIFSDFDGEFYRLRQKAD